MTLIGDELIPLGKEKLAMVKHFLFSLLFSLWCVLYFCSLYCKEVLKCNMSEQFKFDVVLMSNVVKAQVLKAMFSFLRLFKYHNW